MDNNTNPYRIEAPAIINFSGGRSSGYMLAAILAAHHGNLPCDVHVCFANTGKERLETLEFVQECSNQFGVTIHWLQFDGEQAIRHRFREVDFESAARHGEPFETLIQQKQYLPNPVTRFCSVDLKIKVARDFALSLGWEHWTSVIGFRADEAHRLNRAFRGGRRGDGEQLGLLTHKSPTANALVAQNAKPFDRWLPIAPMIDAGVTKEIVLDFWRQQPFDLQLKDGEGNCDLCFLKSAGNISQTMRKHPGLATWWLKMENMPLSRATGRGGVFRKDRPNYQQLYDAVQLQQPLDFGIFDDMMTCGSNACTD